MDPVMRALQSIADVESETRELGQLEPASACRIARFEPTTTYATSEGTADLNTDSRALEIADVETNASEAAGAWDEEIKIGRCDRIVIAPARDVTRHAVTLIVGASLSALAFCVVWLGGSDSLPSNQHCSPRKPSNFQQIDRILQNRASRQLHRRTRLLHQSVVCTALQNAAFNT
jgi:hypothetical protein